MRYLAVGVPGLSPIEPPGGRNIPVAKNLDDVYKYVNSGIAIFLFAVVVLSVLYLITGGMQWILSGGDKSKVQAARNRITYAIIGLIFAFLAFAIINFVAYLFKIDLLNVSIPT